MHTSLEYLSNTYNPQIKNVLTVHTIKIIKIERAMQQQSSG